MTLDKNKTVSAIGRRTRLRNHDVQRMLEALIDVWTDELAGCGRIDTVSPVILSTRTMLPSCDSL